MKLPCAAPPLHPLARLETLAAGPAVPSVAWWITLQVSEHLFAAVASVDPRTGAYLVQPLSELLAALRLAGANGTRPFPADRLWRAADFACEPLARLLHQHRHRTIRSHAQLPFHRIRELDARSLSWLATRPGRTVREKLVGRQRMLGVQRSESADTMENRVLALFARQWASRAEARLAHEHAYDQQEGDLARRGRVAEMVDLCRNGLARSELDELPANGPVRPNNVLLSDPQYSRVYRAWQWLRDEDAALAASWGTAMERARTALFWLIGARLAGMPGITAAETLARVVDGGGIGAEVLAHTGSDQAWLPNPELRLVAPGCMIRLALRGDGVSVNIGRLKGQGALHVQPGANDWRVGLRPSGRRAAPGRGIPCEVEYWDGRVQQTFADLAGLGELGTQTVGQIARLCGIQPGMAPFAAAPFTVADVDPAAPLGVALGGSALHVWAAGNARPLEAMASAAMYSLPGQEGAAWVGGRTGRMPALGQPDIYCMDDVVEMAPEVDPAVLAASARQVALALARELDLPTATRLAWTMPDGCDALAQRALHGAMHGAFAACVPVWRSVAAAMAWLQDNAQGVAIDDEVVVFDAEFSSAVITRLTLRHDDELARRLPESAGLYWERRPSFDADEQAGQSGWPSVLQAYGCQLLERGDGAAMSSECRGDLVAHLVRTGAMAKLVADGGSLAISAGVAGNSAFDAICLRFDAPLFWQLTQKWLAQLRSVLERQLQRRTGRCNLLVLGGPFGSQPWRAEPPQQGTLQFVDHDKQYGFIGTRAGKKIYLRASALPGGVIPAVGTQLGFSIVEAAKGPSALNARPVSDAETWCRKRLAVITPHQIAAGAAAVLVRQAAGCVSWMEWLPDLGLEAICDGHFAQIRLLGQDTLVDPVLGSRHEFPVAATFTLARGLRRYALPLSEERGGRRPLGWETWLQSNVLPLAQDVPVTLGLCYAFGSNTSYRLLVRPQPAQLAPFAALEAQWAAPAMDAPPLLLPDQFALPRWGKWQEGSFKDSVDQVVAGTLDALIAHVRARPEERNWNDASPGVRGAAQALCTHLRGSRASGRPEEINHLLALAAVTALRDDEAGRIAELDDEVGDSEDVPGVLRLLALVAGNSAEWRDALLERLLLRMRRHSMGERFNPSFGAAALRALAKATWRWPGLVDAIAAKPGAATWLSAHCLRSLHSLLLRVPVAVADEEHRALVARLYMAPFVNACELLLALCRHAPREGPLLAGSESALALAKAIRQLDARFHALKVERRWWLGTSCAPPPALRYFSAVAYVLGEQLAPGTAESLLQANA